MALRRLVSRLGYSTRLLQPCSAALRPLSSPATQPAKEDAWQLKASQQISIVAPSSGEKSVFEKAKGVVTYKLHVVTGNLRGAGSNSAVFVKIIGTKGESREVEISEGLGFEKGGVVTESVVVNEDIGVPKMILVKRAQSEVSDTGSGWYLEKMVVEDPNGEALSFPCMQWFGISDCGDVTGPLERYLVPYEEIEIMDPQPVQILASATAIPHPQKLLDGVKGVNKGTQGRGGEDSYFYSFGQNSIFGMGVADGVYAMREQGIDSGIFSGTLMQKALEMVKRGYDDVVQVMKTVSRYVETEGVYGSSTCCILTVNMNQGLLSSATLGDSGFMVIGSRVNRPEVHVVYRTSQQEHEFGWPYALGHHEYASKPGDAMMKSMQVFPGDTIIMGSDGLFDNVFIAQIVEQVSLFRRKGKGPQGLVQKLTEMAHTSSLDRHEDTPYSRGYSEAFDLAMSGGKPDDITVLVAHVL